MNRRGFLKLVLASLPAAIAAPFIRKAKSESNVTYNTEGYSNDAAGIAAKWHLYDSNTVSQQELADWEQDRCPKCGQIDFGQYGEYPCNTCGRPTLWDDKTPDSETIEKEYANLAIWWREYKSEEITVGVWDS